MVDHLKVGAVDGPSEAAVKKAERMYIIIISAEEGRAPKRMQIHNLSDMPNTNIATPGIRISYHDIRRYVTVTFTRHWHEQSCQSHNQSVTFGGSAQALKLSVVADEGEVVPLFDRQQTNPSVHHVWSPCISAGETRTKPMG